MPEPTEEMQRNKIAAFSRAMIRSEQLLTGAISLGPDGDEEVWQRWMDWATAIADEWAFHPDLRTAILDSARENAAMQRSLSDGFLA